ncbi:MAG: hypothetical protein KGZ86_03985 [Candidatus Latescibacteria bacterium]|nr:hypothetical protein [Candidatus Latescibacterota bacterium]
MKRSNQKKTTEAQSSQKENLRKPGKDLKRKDLKNVSSVSSESQCLCGKVSIDHIVEDFTNKLIKGEKITIDQILKKYPKIADKLKPLLESTQLLLQAGDQFDKQIADELKEYDEELWQELEKNILAKSVKQVQKQEALLKKKETKTLSQRFEYLILMLYVKGYHARIGESIRGITRFIKALFLLEKETDLAKLIKTYYDFVPYKIGPFDPAIYQDLKVLELAGIIKRQTYKYRKPTDDSKIERFDDVQIDEGFQFNDESTLFVLTDNGMKYAKALAKWCDQKDENILLNIRRIKTKYGSAPLKYLLKYIYENYPDYTKESEFIKDILK